MPSLINDILRGYSQEGYRDKDISLERAAAKDKESWVIYAKGNRVGKVEIMEKTSKRIGTYASISVFINKPEQGKGIGKVAYRLACEQSKHDTIYAHMSKSNVASRKAAEAAGFVDVTPSGERQLILKYQK